MEGYTPSDLTGDGGGGGIPQSATRSPAQDLQEREREGETPPNQEGEGMEQSENHSMLPAQGTQEKEGRNPPTRRGEMRR